MTDQVSASDPYGIYFIYNVFDTLNEKEISKDVKCMRTLTNCAVRVGAVCFSHQLVIIKSILRVTHVAENTLSVD